MKWALLLTVAVAACTEVLGNLDRIVAIEISGGTAYSLQEDDTLTLQARALTARGNEASDAPIRWEIVDVDSGQVGFTIDSTTGLVSTYGPGQGRVTARVEALTAGPVTVTVTPAPDSVTAASDTRVTADTTVDDSPLLSVTVYDLTTTPDTAAPLAGVPVEFALVDPAPSDPAAQSFALVQAGTIVEPDSLDFTATTDAGGTTSIALRHLSGTTLPDTAVVAAVVRTAVGTSVPGSPVQFVIVYRGN